MTENRAPWDPNKARKSDKHERLSLVAAKRGGYLVFDETAHTGGIVNLLYAGPLNSCLMFMRLNMVEHNERLSASDEEMEAELIRSFDRVAADERNLKNMNEKVEPYT